MKLAPGTPEPDRPDLPEAGLFPPDPSINWLPCDGAVHYFGPVLSAFGAWGYFDRLLKSVDWKNDETMMFGKRIVTARKVAWYGDKACAYTYSGITKQALPWTPELLELKALAEGLTGDAFNSCLLNHYHHGGEGMGWHSDDEKAIVRNSSIASISLGAERRFCFKHRHRELKASVVLEHGSLLVMKGATQTYWLHSIPKAARLSEPRINLTFRLINPVA